MPSIMCFGKGEKDDADAKKSREIEKQLREDQKKLAREVKLLLLGMAILHPYCGETKSRILTIR